MATYPINCTECKVPLLDRSYNTAGLTGCPSCGIPIRADIFPAIFRQPGEAQAGDSVLTGDESGCFFHPQKRAVVPCAVCGRFLCTLCDIEFNGGHVCPTCIETGKKKSKIRNLETHRVLYDDIALGLSIIPILFFWVTVITAPLSIFIAVRHWKSTTSIIPRTKIRFIVAVVLSTLQIAAWLFLLFFLVNTLKSPTCNQ